MTRRPPGRHRDGIVQFEIYCERVLDEHGECQHDLPDFAHSRDEVLALYRGLLRTRAFDRKAVALQRTGRLGTFASSLGQEAVGVGAGAAMLADDVLVPSFREQSAQLWRGVRMTELLTYWGGDERGSDFAGPREDFPVSIPVASHAHHAAGIALAFQLRNEHRVAVCVLGDGATSKGDFYEALNLAGVWSLPCVFVVCNNQWAISVPREQQTAAATLAQKALAAGIEGVQVDGNDVLGVRAVVAAALERARTGAGPTLVEALTYRLADHTTADDASRYRDDEAVSRHWPYEPVVRLRHFLDTRYAWSKSEEHALLAEIDTEVEQAASTYLETAPESPAAMFDHLYAVLPASLEKQRASLLAHAHVADDDRGG